MKINPSVVCELVGDDVVVLDSENSAVVTLTGDSAGVVRRILAGEKVSEGVPGVTELLASRVLVSESPSGLSRRSLVMSGAAVGVGGVLALSLPAAAGASSTISGPTLPAPEFESDAYSYIEDNEARIKTDDISNFDGNLTYEFRFAGAGVETFFAMVLVIENSKEILFYSGVEALPGWTGSLPIASLLRVTNADGEFSEATAFDFKSD